ncbi:hypothetical protein GCM10023228_23230 [Brevibacillus fulvus]|nr:MarR family transcriptional regulator [Brevibacillus fulvus]
MGDSVENDTRQRQIEDVSKHFFKISQYFLRQWLEEENERLSAKQFILLRALFELKRCTVSELAAEINLSASATTIALNKLVKSGYVHRVRCENDRRVVWVEVAPEIIPYINQLIDRRRQIMEQLLESLTDEELAQFKMCLQKMKMTT